MPNLYSLRALAAVAETGSITEAARRMGVSQPAVTRAIRQLEDDIGYAVLERRARGVGFTERGQALLAHARLVAELEHAASAEAAHWIASRPAEVRVAASDVAVAVLAPAALRLLRQTAPAVQVRFVEAAYPDVLHFFRDDLIDLAIGPVPPAHLADRFRVETLFDVPLVVAVAAGHAARRSSTLARLATLGWVVQKTSDGPIDALEQIFGQAGLPVPTRVLACESVSTALQFIEQEGCAGLVPEQLAQDAVAAGRIAIVPLREALPRRTVGIFHPLQRPLTAAARALYSALRMAGVGGSPRRRGNLTAQPDLTEE